MICHRLHGGLELIATGAAIRKAKDMQFLVYTTVLLIAHNLVVLSYNEHHNWHTSHVSEANKEHSILRGNKPPLS